MGKLDGEKDSRVQGGETPGETGVKITSVRYRPGKRLRFNQKIIKTLSPPSSSL